MDAWLCGAVPLILLVALHHDYHYPLGMTLDLMTSLLAVMIYRYASPKQPWIRGLLFVVLLAILYIVTAAHAVFFALLVILDEIQRKHWHLAGVYALLTAIVPYLAVSTVFLLPLHQAYTRHLTTFHRYHATWLSWALLGLYPLLWLYVTQTRLPERLHRKSPLFRTISCLMLLLAITETAKLSFNRKAKVFFLIDYYAQHRQWSQVLQTASHGFPHHSLVQCHINRALYHTGRLTNELFRWTQSFGAYGLFLEPSLHSRYPGQHADIFADLGLVNESEHWGYEAMAVYGETPANLQRLAVAHLLKDDPVIAKRYTRHLSQALWHRKWAQQMQAYLDDPNQHPDFAGLDTARRFVPTQDFLVPPAHPQLCLAPLLAQSSNRMVWEYTLVYTLLEGDLTGFARLLKRLPEFHDQSLPRHVEEALLILQQVTGKTLTIPGHPISKGTKARFTDFHRILTRHGNNRASA